jgi:hypothetical protein
VVPVARASLDRLLDYLSELVGIDGGRILDVFAVLNPDKLPRELSIERKGSTPAKKEMK